MILILLFIQVLILAIMFLKLTDYIIYLYSFFTVLSTILVIYIFIFNKKIGCTSASYKLLAILILYSFSIMLSIIIFIIVLHT